MRPVLHPLLLGTACAALWATPARAQVFVRNTTDVPDQTSGPARYTENVDFADVDLDGDFDAAFANGGDLGNLQDILWINQGGLQGGTVGVFADETAMRYPILARDGRDVEFVDFDNDGDQDVYVSNTSATTNQGNTWFTNEGGLQGGSPGYFVDETAARWVGLGGPGSSIAPSQLVLGTFIDWSCDCDFGDLDNDGDMDLVHSTYGGNFNGLVPTRIFLNDGDGRFREFNPSGFQLTGSTIANGDPGLWCEGLQSANTSDTTGAFCDIATTTLDIDVGDVDGDFDLDILHGDRDNPPRFFYNRLEENGGKPADLAFRDVTNFVYAPNWGPGTGHYEQEMGDFDNDGDLDLFGLNWQAGGFNGFDDIVAKNTGGVFGPQSVLPNSSTDDNEGDFGDFDNDGDLDLYIANFSGDDRLYANDGTGVYSFVPGDATGSGLQFHGLANYTSLDAEWCDVDEDGDYDVFSAQDSTKPVVFWENTTQVPDTTPPSIPNVEVLGNQTARLDRDFPVRAHVYDNAAYYVTWYNTTVVDLSVDGVSMDTLPARSVGGQVFRASLPANLVGTVAYTWRSTDRCGNSGTSATSQYQATADRGGGTTIPIDRPYGTGTAGSAGTVPDVRAKSIFTGGKPLYLAIETGGAVTPFVLSVSRASLPPTPIPGLGTLNIDPTGLIKSFVGVTGAAGTAGRKLPIAPGLMPGFAIYWQVFALDGVGGDTFSSSLGLEVTSR